MKFPRFPRQPLAGLFIAAAVGIAGAEYLPGPLVLPLCTMPLAAVLVFWRKSNAATFLFTACAFFLLHSLRPNPGKALADELSGNPARVTATGVVATEPEVKQKLGRESAYKFRLRLKSIAINGSTERPCEATMMVTWYGDAPEYGDLVEVEGAAINISSPRNPGEFDYAGWLQRQGIYSQITVAHPVDGQILEGGHGNPVMAMAIRTRHWMEEKLRLDLEYSPNVSGLIEGIVLGRKSEIPEDIKDAFQATGTMHLFVVNGLHIGMFAAIAFLFVQLFGRGPRFAAGIVLPLIWFYAALTGLSTGSIRAATMASIFLGARFFDRKPVSLNNLAAAGLALMMYDTNELFMAGFQFSFGVVLVILLLTGRLQRFFEKFGKPDPFIPRVLWTKPQIVTEKVWTHFSQLAAVSTAASIGSFPFTTAYFHMFTLSALAANLVIVPTAFLVLAEGLLSIVAACFSTTLAMIFNNANWCLAHFMLWAVNLFAQLPGGHVAVGFPNFFGPACEVTVLDMGAGGAIHLRSQGRDWMIDCGKTAEYESIVRPYLRMRGVDSLDGFILTHGNTNFVGAAPTLETDLKPRLTGESSMADRSHARHDFHQWIESHGITEEQPKPGDVLEISPAVKLRVLYPPGDSDARVADDKALVLLLECGKCRVLFMSSSGAFTEHWLLEHEHDLHCDILVKNQRSSGASATTEFIDAAHPRIIVCSSTNYPPSAQVDEAWAAGIAARGIRLFRQDETGAVTLELNNDRFAARSFLGNHVFFSRSL